MSGPGRRYDSLTDHDQLEQDPGRGRYRRARAARGLLEAGRGLVGLTPPVNRPMVRALVGLDLLTADAAAARGAALLRGSARPAVPAALGLLLREYRAARRARR